MKRLFLFIAVLWPFIASASCPETMVFTALATFNNTANTTLYTTTSLASPTANTRLYAMVVNSKASAPNIPTFSGYGLAWTQLSTTNFNTLGSPTERLTVFTAVATAPTGTLPAASFSAAQTGCIIRVVQVTHSVYPIQIVTTASNTVANPTITMAAIGTGGTNSVLTFWGNSQNAYGGTAKANWVEDYDGGYNSPATGGYLMYRINTTDNIPTNTVTSQSWAGVALEIPAEPCPGTAGLLTILTNGWQATLTLDGTSTNGTYNFGLGDNNTLSGNESAVFNLTSLGYDDGGNAITNTRTVYGTKQIRMAYPNQAYSDELQTLSITTIKFALSDYIYQSDSNIIATIQSKIYAGAPLGYTNLVAVTNSLASHQKVIANWSWPSWQRSSGNSLSVRAVAFHRHGQYGRPVRVVKFVATGASSGLSLTNFVTHPSIDASMPDYGKVCEYISNFDLTGFTAKELVRVDFTAYPWIGDSGSVLSTTDNVNSMPIQLYASITNLCDNAGNYGELHAIVDPAGVDATGLVETKSQWSGNTTPSPFLTINGAAAKIAATNNLLYGHNDLGGAFIHLTNGSWNFSGGSYSTPATWCTITRHPNASRAGVIIGNASGTKNLGDRLRLYDITIASVATITFSAVGALWFDQCTINNPGVAMVYHTTRWYITHSDIQSTADGLQYYTTTENSPLCLLRGTLLNMTNSANNNVLAVTMIGNKRTITNDFSAGDAWYTDGAGMPYSPGQPICAFNFFYGCAFPGGDIKAAILSTNYPNGFAFVQNILEDVRGTGAAIYMAADDVAATNISNVIVWNNTIVGQRHNGGYNGYGSTLLTRKFWSRVGNLFEDDNIKTDIFTPGDGNRTGDWSEVWGVGHENNWLGEVENIGTSAFTHSDSGGQPGLNSFESSDLAPVSTNYVSFVSRAAYDGVNRGTGSGNYRLLSNSPLISYQSHRWVLPFDIEGNRRGLLDPAGAYASAIPRKGAGFFAP